MTPTLESMTLLVAAVIVHDKATNRVVLLQRSQNAEFAQGMWDLPVGKSEPGEPITKTAAPELYEQTGLTVKPDPENRAPRKHAQVGWAGAIHRPTLQIVKRSDDVTGFVVLPRRWVVESTLSWLKRSRRLVRDYETLPAMHEAMVLWSMTMLMSSRLNGRRSGAFSRPAP